MTTPLLPGSVRVTNLRRHGRNYKFDLTLDVTLRDVWYRRASGEFGFPPQATPVSAEQAGRFAEYLQSLVPVLAEGAL